jgi:hypothetical protein
MQFYDIDKQKMPSMFLIPFYFSYKHMFLIPFFTIKQKMPSMQIHYTCFIVLAQDFWRSNFILFPLGTLCCVVFRDFTHIQYWSMRIVGLVLIFWRPDWPSSLMTIGNLV